MNLVNVNCVTGSTSQLAIKLINKNNKFTYRLEHSIARKLKFEINNKIINFDE